MCLVPFDVQIPEADRDSLYFERYLAPEIDGILAWMIEGLMDYRSRGDRTDPPAAVRAATMAWRADMDLVARFINEQTARDDSTHTSSTELWRAFETFMFQEGGRQAIRRDFISRFEELTGLTSGRTRDGGENLPRGYRGIALVQQQDLQPAI